MRRLKYSDHWISLSLFVISIFGVVMIGSASAGSAGEYGGTYALENMIKQGIFLIIGFVLMMLLRRKFSTRWMYPRTIKAMLIIVLILMAACLAFPSVSGSKAWIRLPFGMSIQPSEFAKIALMLMMSYYLVETPKAFKKPAHYVRRFTTIKQYEHYRLWQCVGRPLAMAAVVILFCMVLQHDFGTSVIMAGIVAVCFFCASDRYYAKFQKPLFIGLAVAFFAVILIGLPILTHVLEDYQLGRILAWLDPLSDPYNTSFHQINGLIAFAKNGFFGLGLGNSTQKFGYIPEAQNDYISAIIFEELGVFGLALIIIPYTIIIYRLFSYAYKMKDPKHKIILCGIASYFFLHLFLNLGGVSCLIPLTGVPLLCISSGGSSTIAAYVAIGIAQALISQHNREKTRLAQEGI